MWHIRPCNGSKSYNQIFTTRGFTLIEIMVAIAIFVFIVLMVTQTIVQGYNTNRFSLEMADATEYAKKGIENMVKEMREASFADNGDYPIANAEGSQIIFYSDIDSDAAVEKVRYFLNGTNLIKGVIKPTAGQPVQYLSSSEATSTISRYIQNGATPIFYYYNGNYPIDTVNNPLPMPVMINDIRLMRVYLKINIIPNRPPDDFSLEVFVNFRNLKDNL